ncbi:SDR family oxidoreductase [Chitinophaga arvensicola]|uniref:NAD(P)-dependent dehydrogenase, short-chain alcohol dehydrogenase family n=1 Tax=Chitinophaga arvensicola TaxID=29529 RepID=A0A1I0RLT9_9BACT|nr:SDR family oxidoreductase [Chitinophaga arvensicola]SEW42083.1 NAD(P)-dependent dehydrogenase, short-chain alcohol dehydrogenase family [Chitinophaga arvensicola]
MNTDLTGKKVLVLGGSAGIGFATAQAAARVGADVVIVSSNQQRVTQALSTLPATAQGFALDLRDEAALRDFFENITAFDHLVFTAGGPFPFGELATVTNAAMLDGLQLRFLAAMNAVKYGSRKIKPGGSVVLTTGIASERPQKGWVAGACICGAMEGFTRAMAVELAPIRVNAVSPGVVKTDLWANMPAADREAMYEQVAGLLPVGRAGEPEDIAQTYLYLMQNGFSTGQVVIIDGGAVLV